MRPNASAHGEYIDMACARLLGDIAGAADRRVAVMGSGLYAQRGSLIWLCEIVYRFTSILYPATVCECRT